MSATVRGGWPTVWPTVQASQRAHGCWPHRRRSESGAEDQGAVSPLVTTGGGSRTLFVLRISVRRSAGWCLRLRACRGRVRRGVGRNPVIGGPGPCHVEQDQHKICAGNGSEDRGDQSYQSYATSSASKSSKGPTHDHQVLGLRKARLFASFPPARAPSWGCAGAFLGLRCAVADRAASGL
jgi:hypothetical protein